MLATSSNTDVSTEQATRALPKGLVQIKAMLGNKRYKPHFIYDSVLNEHERNALCYTARLGKSDLKKSFYQLTDTQRLSIQKALLLMDKIYLSFLNVNAISPSKFLQNDPQAIDTKGTLS